MHLTMKDQDQHGKTHIMCMERSVQVCIILNTDPEHAETYVTLAGSVGISEVFLLVRDTKRLVEYLENNWTTPQGTVLLSKRTR